MEIDLRKVGFRTIRGGGVAVPLFSDLKRHKMGAGTGPKPLRLVKYPMMNSLLPAFGVLLTPRPTCMTAVATTLEDAIRMHGGEAQEARDNFVALTEEEQANLLFFLDKLRTPTSPNAELFEVR